MTPILQAAAIAAVSLGTGAATLSVMSDDIPDLAVPEMEWVAGTELDGRRFAITATLDRGDEMQTDVLHFEDGGFMSLDCEVYCNFGFTEYRTWTNGEVIHFTTAPTCADAPHHVVWYGTVIGDEIEIEMTWTTRRWYWTHQIVGQGGGMALPDATDDVGAAG